MTAPVYGHSAIVPVPAGLDPKRFQATLLVDRKDGRPLSKADRDALAAVLVALDTEEKPAAKAPRKAPAKAKAKAPARPRSSSKAPARKAARRPSKG
jgi:hypothetical protein